MRANPAAQSSLDCWVPSQQRGLFARSVHDRVLDVHRRYPDGFQRDAPQRVAGVDAVSEAEEFDADLAEWELKRYKTMRRVRVKLKAVIFWMRLLSNHQRSDTPRAEAASACDATGDTVATAAARLPLPAAEPDFEA